ncbi:uncharacterized protein LOC123506912 isoform X2 [Portunus trituberculatus]|nr:uncharacterized protein LOC123506912 isoform X2 [Portunus trituberculatus]
MSSPVFEAMLYGPLAEGPEVTLKEDHPEALQWVLEYMYRGHTRLPEVALTVKVYQLASKYQMEALMSLCSEFLQATLTAANLPEIYDTAMLLEDTMLLEKCSKVVNHSPASVLSSPHMGRLSRPALTHLLQHPLHITSEVVLLEALLRWGHAQGTRKELREEIEEFLPQVRFLTLTTDEFVEHVMPAGVLTLSEMTALLMSIKQLQGVSLPPLCCPEREKRLCYDETLLRSITLAPRAASSRSRKQARGSNFVHAMNEQILIADLRTATPLQLARIECRAIHPTSGTACVCLKDSEGNLLASVTAEGTEARFSGPVTLKPSAAHSVTVSLEGHWPRGELGEAAAMQDEVRLTARVAYTEGRSGSVTLYFWSFN